MSEQDIKEKDNKSEKLKPLIVFQYNDELNEFQELEVEEDKEILEVLDSDLILLFVDPTKSRVWLWHGSNTKTRMKFMAAKLAPIVRDKYGKNFKIAAVDEDSETLGFDIMTGLVEELDNVEEPLDKLYEM